MDRGPPRAHAAPVRDLGRTLLVLGLVTAALGAALMVLPRVPWLGRLPGDLHVERGPVSVYVPLVTCLVVSAVVTLLLNLFFRR